MRSAVRFALLVLLFAALTRPVFGATECACDAGQPETMKARQCSLCNEAEKQAGGQPVFFLKDINPRKPNRWLALPKQHGTGGLHHLHELSKGARSALWAAAIEKSKSMWGDDWGVAYNGENVRTQCHTHIHIGKMMKHVENAKFVVVRRVSDIPAPPSEGIWIHGTDGGAMHVHLGEQTTETVLMR